jgi:hypothetical protein
MQEGHPMATPIRALPLEPPEPEVRARALREAQRVLDEHTVEALRDYPDLANLFVWFRLTNRRGP